MRIAIGKFMLVLTAALFLSGCAAPATAPAEPTLDANAIRTSAAETALYNLGQTLTAMALEVTPTPSATPTSVATATPTPTRTALPTDPPAVSHPGTTGGVPCDRAFLNGENYSGGVTVAPGTTIVKDWFLYNGGTCTWTTEYQLIYFDGDIMGSALVLPMLPAGTTSVPPEGMIHLRVAFTAPATPGTYTGYWRFRNPEGYLFGYGALADYNLRVRIISLSP